MELDLAGSIRANTAAVQALTAAIERQLGVFDTKEGMTVREVAAAVEQARLISPQAEIAKAPPKHGETEAPKALTFEDVKPLVFNVAQSNRAGLIYLLGQFNVKKAVDVPVADLPEFKRMLEQLGGLHVG